MIREGIGVLATPTGADDHRPLGNRRACALKEVFADALGTHGLVTDTRHHETEPDDEPDDEPDTGEDVPLEDALIPAPRQPEPAAPAAAPETTRGPGRALLTITMDHRWLQLAIGHGTLDSGALTDPATVRRWACDADIVPLVLGSKSEPLEPDAHSRPWLPARHRPPRQIGVRRARTSPARSPVRRPRAAPATRTAEGEKPARVLVEVRPAGRFEEAIITNWGLAATGHTSPSAPARPARRGVGGHDAPRLPAGVGPAAAVPHARPARPREGPARHPSRARGTHPHRPARRASDGRRILADGAPRVEVTSSGTTARTDPWSGDPWRGSVAGMDIGPVRRRLTAEPISSPVPGEDSPEREPVMIERAVEHDDPETVATSRT